MESNTGITQYFGKSLAELLSDKIKPVYPEFDHKKFIDDVDKEVVGKSYTERIKIHADLLHEYLPAPFTKAVGILLSVLGDENPNETGMFTHYYWVMPIGKFIEVYGLNDFQTSMNAIAEVTKRNTGEYAIRPYIRNYPEKSLEQMAIWSKSENFHLRRLASEGLRPKLPWAPKLETFIDNPEPVFDILENLKEDEVKFVKKSVGNHLTDWLKVNIEPTKILLKRWSKSDNKHTQWIVKHATRKIKVLE